MVPDRLNEIKKNTHPKDITALFPWAGLAQALTGVRDGLPPCPAHAPWPAPPCGGRSRSAAQCRAHTHQVPARPCAVPDLGVRTDQVLFFEPVGLRNELDFSPQKETSPWTTYGNIAYAPHTYVAATMLP